MKMNRKKKYRLHIRENGILFYNTEVKVFVGWENLIKTRILGIFNIKIFFFTFFMCLNSGFFFLLCQSFCVSEMWRRSVICLLLLLLPSMVTI